MFSAQKLQQLLTGLPIFCPFLYFKSKSKRYGAHKAPQNFCVTGYLFMKLPHPFLQAFSVRCSDNSYMVQPEMNFKQDGRLAPAYFSPEYKYFDQHLQTVKNETTV